MEIIEFAEKIRESAQQILGENYFVEVCNNLKLNNVNRVNITIHSKSINIAPSIYLDGFYNDYNSGKSFGDVMNELMEAFWKFEPSENLEIGFINDYENIRESIYCGLCNYEMNSLMLENMPYVPFLDLAVYFYIEVESQQIGCGTIRIRNDMLKLWNIDSKKLMKVSLDNSEKKYGKKCFSMLEYFLSQPQFAGFFDDDKVEDILDNNLCDMWILTNKKFFNGSNVILFPGYLSEIAKDFDSGYYIIPSSIHELILVPDKKLCAQGLDLDYLRSIVVQVNSTEVTPNEVLSNNIYYFDKSSGKVSIA